MLDMTLKELYEIARIDGATLDIRFDFPRSGEIAFRWFKDGRCYSRVFSSLEVETMRIPESFVCYVREQAERELNKCER